LPDVSSGSTGVDRVDPIIGLRISRPLKNDWALTTRADVGGFGVDSEITYGFSAGAVYKVNDQLSLDLKYKAVWSDSDGSALRSSSHFTNDTIDHGPTIGVMFTF